MINEPNPEKTKRLILAEKQKPIIVRAQDDEYNRKMLEYGKFDILLSIESGKRKTGLRQIDSGLNHVLAKIAVKSKIAFGINMEEIAKLEKKEKALRLERIIQNIKISRKAKAAIKLLNFKDKKNAFAFLTSLGASSQQAKSAL